MNHLYEQKLVVDGIESIAWRNEGPDTAIVFIHGGQPGLLPYCSSPYLWAPCAHRFAEESPVVVLELPGTGRTDFRDDGLTLNGWIAHLHLALEQLGLARAHLVAHDTAGLAALLLAHEDATRICGVTVVSSVAATPTGDGVENLTLAYPPVPLWSKHSQRWALEQISYAHHHIDAALLEHCVRAAEGAVHRRAIKHMADPARRLQWKSSISQAKSRLFEICRDKGIPVPVQVVWGTHDPLGTVDQAMWSYRLLAQRQPTAQFHLINRAGAMPFREEVETFHQVVSAFADYVFAASVS